MIKPLKYQAGAVQIYFVLQAVAIGIVRLITLLGSIWTAFTSTLSAYAALKYLVGFIVAASWLATFIALIISVHALLPTTAVNTAVSTAQGYSLYSDFFLPWFQFMKPAGLATYISSIAASYVATRVYMTWATILELRSSS